MTDRLPNGVTACPHGRGHNQPCPECRKIWDEAMRKLEEREHESAS